MNLFLKVFFLFSIIALMRCGGDPGFDCLKSTGSITIDQKKSPVFHTVIISNNIDLVLTNDSTDQIQIEAGKNLISKIKFTSTGDTLFITNENTCNWVRSYKYGIKVTLPVPEILKVYNLGNGEISNKDILKLHTLNIFCLDAGGNANLNINTTSFIAYTNSASQMTLSGKSAWSALVINKGGLAKISAENLISENCVVNHNGNNEIRTRAIKNLNVKIMESGNVYYYDEPETIDAIIKGSGKLIKM